MAGNEWLGLLSRSDTHELRVIHTGPFETARTGRVSRAPSSLTVFLNNNCGMRVEGIVNCLVGDQLTLKQSRPQSGHGPSHYYAAAGAASAAAVVAAAAIHPDTAVRQL